MQENCKSCKLLTSLNCTCTNLHANLFIFTLTFLPFTSRIESNALPALCNSTTAPVVSSNPSGSAQFFVAVGVLAMLYTIGSLLWYVIYEARYPEKEIHYLCVSTSLLYGHKYALQHRTEMYNIFTKVHVFI